MADLAPEGLRALAKVLALALEPIWPGLPRLYADWADEASPKIERAFITIVAEVDKLHEEALAGLLRLRVAEARRAQREADAMLVEQMVGGFPDSKEIAAAIHAQGETP